MNIPLSYGAPRNKPTWAYALVATAMLIVMLVAQLFHYEDFASVLAVVVSVNDASLLAILAGCIVLAELLALPYLLGMYVSRLMRVISALLGFGMAGFWLFTSFTNAHAGNIGMFSSTLELPGGLLAAVWSIVLFSLVCKVIFADSRFRHATLEV